MQNSAASSSVPPEKPFTLDPDRRVIRHLRGISIHGILLGSTDVPKKTIRSTKSSADLQRLTAERTILGLHDPVQKQLKLQEINSRSLVETFVSLHTIASETPFYVTEVVKDTAYPVFEEFDLTALTVSRKGTLTINVWCREQGKNWTLLQRTFIRLSLLQSVGTDLAAVEGKFPRNSIVLKLGDVYYLVNPVPDLEVKLHRRESHTRQKTCSFDQIMKLNNIQMSLVDTLNVKQKAAAEINSMIEGETDHESRKLDLKMQIEGYRLSIARTKGQVEELKTQVARTWSLIKRKRELMRQKPEERVGGERIAGLREEYGTTLNALEDTKEKINIERARVANELSLVFPIAATERSYEFSLFGLKMPPVLRSLSKTKEMEVAALLGFVCQIVYMLSAYLRVPLRFPVEPFGSHSYITDPISIISGSRLFPLWVKENIMYRFEYGLMLLCKNIEQLMESVGLKTAEPKNILGNLKILLLCISSKPYDELSISALENAHLYRARLEHIKRHLNQRNINVN